MTFRKKSWNEKLSDNKNLPRIKPIPENMRKRWGEGTFVIPAPKEVDSVMKKIKHGKLTTINEIRKYLSKKYKTNTCCPICTGIFSWISANAAEENSEEGKKNNTPYWRTLKSGGELNPKYPGGIENQKKHLETEGQEIYSKGKKWFVFDYESKLQKL